jgi:hypothetical protein
MSTGVHSTSTPTRLGDRVDGHAAPTSSHSPDSLQEKTRNPSASCSKASNEKRCEEWDAYHSCKRSDFKEIKCRRYGELNRDQESLIADCRKSDILVRGANTCAEAEDRVVDAYLDCRFEGKSSLQCEWPAVYEACIYRGGGSLCMAARPVYSACRVGDVNGEGVKRYICIEGNIEYQICRHAWGVTVNGDVCVAATAVYERCRVRSPIYECEGRRNDYAKANYR